MLEPDTASEIPIFLCYRRVDGDGHAEWLFKALHGYTLDGAVEQPSARLNVYFDQAAPATEDWTAVHFPRLMRAKALIVICSPGIRNDISQPGRPDWAHRELDWWCKHRKQAPILIDTTGDDRWIPDAVRLRWPRNNRIELLATKLAEAKQDEQVAARIRDRIVGGIRQSQHAIVFEDLERFRRLNRRQGIWLRVAVVAIVLAVGFAIAAWLNAVTANSETERAQANALEARQHLEFARGLVGEGLALRSAIRLAEDPAEAFVLAFEGARFSPADSLLGAMKGALHANPVWRRITVSEVDASTRPLLAGAPDKTDSLAVDPDLKLLVTASQSKVGGIESSWPLHLYDIEAAELLASRDLGSDDRLLTAHPVASEVFALQRRQTGGSQLELYPLVRDGWESPLWSVADGVDWTTAGGHWPCFVLRADGEVWALDRDAGGQVHGRVLTRWPGAAQIVADASGGAIALAGPHGLAWVDVISGELRELQPPPPDPPAHPSRGPQPDLLHFGPRADTLLVIYAEQALYEPKVNRSLWAIFPRTGAMVKLPCAPAPMFPGIHTVFEVSADRRRLAVSEQIDGQLHIGVYELDWSGSGDAVEVSKHSMIRLRDDTSESRFSSVASLAPSGRYLVVGGMTREDSRHSIGTLRSWELSEPAWRDGLPTEFKGVDAPVGRVLHSADSSRVLAWDANEASHVFRVILQPPAFFGAGVRMPEDHSVRFFGPRITYQAHGRLAMVAFSETDVRAFDVQSGHEYAFAGLSPDAHVLATSWRMNGSQRLVVSSREFLLEDSDRVLERHVFEAPAQHAWAGRDLAVAGSGEKLFIFRRGEEPMTMSLTVPEGVKSVSAHEHAASAWIYAMASGTFHSWKLGDGGRPAANQPLLSLTPSVRSWKAAGNRLVVLVGEDSQVPRLYALDRGRECEAFEVPSGGWPTDLEAIGFMDVAPRGELDLVLSASRKNFAGHWDPSGTLRSWTPLPEGNVVWVEPSSGSLAALALIRDFDGSLRLTSLADGVVLDEAHIDHESSVPPPVQVEGHPAFAVVPALPGINRRVALGGLDSPHPVTNVRLPKELEDELRELARGFEASSRQLSGDVDWAEPSDP